LYNRRPIGTAPLSVNPESPLVPGYFVFWICELNLSDAWSISIQLQLQLPRHSWARLKRLRALFWRHRWSAPGPRRLPFCECVIFATDVQWDKYSDATQVENIYEISKGTSATRKQGARMTRSSAVKVTKTISRRKASKQ